MTTRQVPDSFKVAFSFAGEQRGVIRPIVEAVEQALGQSSVFYDEWFQPYLAGGDADLKLREIYEKKCQVVVVCVSADYQAKSWTLDEFSVIRARAMKARNSADDREKFSVLPLRVGDGEVDGLPCNAIVPDVRSIPVEQAVGYVLERLRLATGGPGAAPAPAVRWPAEPPPLTWPLADHGKARGAFAMLVTAGSPQRLLSIKGGSETGKSHITRQILANALRIPDVACGRFDLKGTTAMELEVAAFIQELGVGAPPAQLRLHEQLSHVLASLRQRARPTVLIFDTYEMAGELRDWIEKQLLPSLLRSPWLRVVIAGQKVPESVGSVWAEVACPTVVLVTPPPSDWFIFGKQYRPELTMAQVEAACSLAPDKSSLLAQLLGPVN